MQRKKIFDSFKHWNVAILSVLMSFCMTAAFAQSGAVKGKVLDELGDPIQGDIMLISADEAKTTEARYTVKGLLGRQVLYTARQEGRVLTLDVPDCAATFRTTIQDMKTLMNQGVSTLVLTTEKGSTTLNLSLLCEGQTDTQRVVLRQLGDSAFLTVGLRCRRDLIVGR